MDALKESIAAKKALWTAQQERAKAHMPAYKKFLAFKRVVRDALGRSSAQYRRLHVRAKARRPEEPEEAAPDSAVVPSTITLMDSPAGPR